MVDLNLPAPGDPPNWGNKLNSAIRSMNSVVEGFSPEGIPQEQYIGTNMSAERLPWPGPVYWITTAMTGYPVQAVDGDTLWRVSESSEVIVISQNFSNKPDGAVPPTDVGDKSWVVFPDGNATGASAVIQSGALRLTGYAAGFAYVYLDTGLADSITRMRVASVDTDRTAQIFWRLSDSQNYLAIAMRTSGSDPTARIASYSGGTATIVASLGVTIEAGDLLMMRSRGTFHEIRVNDVTRWSGNISANQSGTRVGVRAAASSKDLTLTSYHTALSA